VNVAIVRDKIFNPAPLEVPQEHQQERAVGPQCMERSKARALISEADFSPCVAGLLPHSDAQLTTTFFIASS